MSEKNVPICGFDVKRMYDARISKFLKKYKDIDNDDIPKGSINSMNVESVKIINDYIDKYYYFNRIVRIIAKYYESIDANADAKNDPLSSAFRSLLRIWHSCKSQFKLSIALKEKLKKVPITQDLYKAIKYVIPGMAERLTYLLDNVITEYINITPLYDYSKILESEGSSLYEDIMEFFPYKYIPGGDSTIQEYVDKINITIGDSTEYRDNLNKFIERQNDKYLRSQKLKYERKLENQVKKVEAAQEALYKQCSALRDKFEKSAQGYEGAGSIGVKSIYTINLLKSQAFDFKKLHNCGDAKIFLVAKTYCGERARMKYYCENKESLMADSIMHATIFKADDPVPTSIQEKVSISELVFCDFIL